MLGVEKFISWLKVAVCARFSAKDTRRNPRIWGSGSARRVQKMLAPLEVTLDNSWGSIMGRGRCSGTYIPMLTFPSSN